MRRSWLFAFLVVAAAAAWVASGQFTGEREAPASAEAPAAGEPEPALPRVRVRLQTATETTRAVVVQGRTMPSRQVSVRAETGGRVVSVGAAEGSRVGAGDVLATLAVDDREARVAEARALVAQREMEHRAARELQRESFASRTKLAEAQANLEKARAQLAEAELDLARTTIAAPIDGVLQDRPVEIGAYVAPGSEVATVLDLTPLTVVGEVTERDVTHIAVGTPATVRMIDGSEVPGRVSYVSAAATPETRTYAVEVEVPNPDAAIPAGMTAQIRVPTRTLTAHRVSAAVLTMDDLGRVGVKTVEDGTVRFHPVRIIGEGPEGLWIAGLPEQVTLITVGGDFVDAGQRVEPVFADRLQAESPS